MTEHVPERQAAQRLHRQQRVLSYAVVGAVAALSVLAGLAFFHYVLDNDSTSRWNPLGAYPTQAITNADRLVAPTDTVNVRAVKCVAVDDPVTVLGSSEWRAVSPPGASVPLGEGQTIRYPRGAQPPAGPAPDTHGCTTFEYANTIPAVVLAQALIDCQQSGMPSTWKITGRETPIRPNGDRGASRVWTTETFKIGC